MIVTQKNIIHGLTKEKLIYLSRLCHESRALYNTALYYIKNYFDVNDSYLSYNEMAFILKTNEHYRQLFAACAQQILKVVDRSFRSFFHILNERKKGHYNKPINPPQFLPKDSMFILIYPSPRLEPNGSFFIPFSRTFSKQVGRKGINIKRPPFITQDDLREVRILPRYNRFEIEWVYEKVERESILDENRVLGIDLGLDNLAVCVNCENGYSFIVDGRMLKSYNRWYNKYIANYQSIVNKQVIFHRTERLKYIDGRRYWFINDYLNQTVNIIIKYCLENKVNTIVIGENKEWKQGIDLGKRNNQNFVSIPHGTLKYKLKCKCDFHGIHYITQEESYTSKCSFLDDEPIEKHDEYLGKRIHRGLFRSSDGTLINADVNSALNIVKKSKQKIVLNDRLCSGLTLSPKRIRIDHVSVSTRFADKAEV